MDRNNTIAKTSKISSLEEVMKYENIDVIERLMQSWNISLEESTAIFNEMKKWLWLCADSAKRKISGEKVPNLAITQSMTLLDEMWHAFMLFTKPYTAFCIKYFGFYIHHGPTTNSQKREIKIEIEKNPEQYFKKIEDDLTVQYEYIYEHLGEETLKIWYSDWTDLYTSEKLNELYIKKW